MSTAATLIGIPIDFGARNLGVGDGPTVFRAQDIVEKLTAAGIQVTDNGDIAVPDRNTLDQGDPHMRYADTIATISAEIAKQAEQFIKDGQKIIAVGGDHSLNLGVFSGASAAYKGDIGMIYLDAHGDMNTPETTLSGNVHGMHLAALMAMGPDIFTKVHTPEVKLAKQNLLHIGGCDFDQAELDLVKRENLQTYSMFDVLTNGMKPLWEMIDDLTGRVSNIWISLDLDSIDEVYAPGAGMPNKRGLLYREIATIAEYVGERCNVVGVDVVEYNPKQDVDHKTAELGIELIAKFLGHEYSWYQNYMNRNAI